MNNVSEIMQEESHPPWCKDNAPRSSFQSEFLNAKKNKYLKLSESRSESVLRP